MVIKNEKLKNIKAIWEEMYTSNFSLSPYSSYDFALCYSKYFRFSLVRMFMVPKFYVFIKNSEILAIVPLICGCNGCYIFGDKTASGYLDIITKRDLSIAEYDELFHLLKKNVKRKFYFNKINDRSILIDYFDSKLIQNATKKCVVIPFNDSYDSYISGLSKNMRQNLRTAYNRLKRMGFALEIKTFFNQKMDNSIIDQEMELYEKRIQSRSKKNKNSIVARYVRKRFNPITNSLKSNQNNFHALLYINNNLAAFLSGFVTNDKKSLIVPRLAIDDEYHMFSPGNLLIVELIKFCIMTNRIRNIDLSRGDEEYKYALGGVTHLNHDFIF